MIDYSTNSFGFMLVSVF